MLSAKSARDRWDEHSRSHPIEPVMTIIDAGLVLGCGTVPAKMRANSSTVPELAVEGGEARSLALLSLAYGDAVGPAVLGNIRRASREWGRGNACLALIHLARTGLPRLPDEQASFHLFLGDMLLAEGLSPRELMKACGINIAGLDLLKAGYNPDEPRVPAGSGRESGEWTYGNAGAESSGSSSAPRGQPPSAAGGEQAQPKPLSLHGYAQSTPISLRGS